jgi:hypothetical protein
MIRILQESQIQNTQLLALRGTPKQLCRVNVFAEGHETEEAA